MKTAPDSTGKDAIKPAREAHLSLNGKWRSFPKVPNLVQYVVTGAYFGRVKVNGKTFRESCRVTFKIGKVRAIKSGQCCAIKIGMWIF